MDSIEQRNRKHDDYRDILTHDIRVKHIREHAVASTHHSMTRDGYLDRVRSIQRHIYEGDIYQANFTTGVEVKTDTRPFDIYRRLRRTSPSNYSAYMNFGDLTILSASPERLLTKRGPHLLTSPIKGTIERGNRWTEGDQTRKLLASAKDRAELLMIIDLERNDLGRVARTGTVTVDNLFYPKLYSSVIHLSGDISAELKSGVSTRQIFEAMLPGGSITGAPKRRAIEIIAAHEPASRGVYTGCIGYFSGDVIDMNLAIRTVVHQGDTYHVHAGGGIVADSIPELEYDEMNWKMRGMYGSLGVTP